jgi:LPS-assembly protein
VPSLAVLAAVGLAALAPPDLSALAGGEGDVRVTADVVRYDVGTGQVLLEGNAVIRRGAVVLRARSASFDPATNEVRATGGVLLTDAARVISADAIRAIVGGELEADGVLAFVKDAPADLSGLKTASEARRAGRNRLTFSGERLRGSATGPLRLTNARLTLCDCGEGAPSWEVTAREAEVVPGRHAILRWSVVRITPRFLLVDHPVPVLVLPWLYLPLGDRQSGALVPVVGSTFASGFSIAQPLYLTLGRSADATLTAEYAFGRSSSDVAEGHAAVRGPGARLELRFAPAERAEGRVELAWLHDLDTEPGGEGGDRWALEGGHAQRLGARATLVAELRLAGDAVWVRDMVPDSLGRALPHRRSDLLASYRRDAVVAEAAGSYLQPLEPEAIPTTGRAYGTLGAGLGVASRWAGATATLVPVPLGPLRLSARAGAVRFAPATAGLDVAARPGVTRADARAELAAPLLVGGAVTVAPFVRGAALGYGFDEGYDPAGSAWAVAGAVVETELSRRYGALRHAVAPRLEWRAGTDAAGDVLPFPAYDPYDRSAAALLTAAPGPFQQLRASVETWLEGRGSSVARALVGQDLDLRAGELAETFAAVSLAAGPVAADARASFFAGGRDEPVPVSPKHIASGLDDFTALRASLSVGDRRGNELRAGFLSVGPGGAGALVAGLDPIFDVRPGRIDASASATAGVRVALGDALLGYEALLPGRAAFVESCVDPRAERRVGALQVQQHTASLGWDSSCRCFRIDAIVRVTDCGDVSYSASLDLAGLAGGLLR